MSASGIRCLLASFALLLLVLIAGVEAAGSCVEANKCCQGRDSSCVVQKAPLNAIIEDLSDEPCYCDHACLKLGDCCHDFKIACQVTDCEVSEWGPWSECDTDCGPGTMSRERLVIREADNGGRHCPDLSQKRGCHGIACHAHEGKALRESATILPANLDYARTVNASKDIRRNLRLKYPKDQALDSSHDYCVEFDVIKASKGCRPEEVNKVLHPNSRVCVWCSKTAMLKGLDYRCRGHGSPHHPTRYTSMSAPTCHGRWTQRAIHQECPCKGGAHFIFV